MKITRLFARRFSPSDGSGISRSPKGSRDRDGIAIVLVLSFLVLITVLIVTFFASVSTEYSGATSYASEANSKHLGDSAVQMVMGAIKQATTSGSNIAWASQPGMIRTYGDGSGGASSAALANYKLYSSDQMVVSGTFNPSGEIDTQWNSKPALYTDLNAPVVAGGTMSYPIVDGNVVPMTISGSNVYTYGSGTAAVEGFYTTPPQSFATGAVVSATNNPVPMPVKWIYVLRDGTLTVPSGASGAVADFSHSNNPPTKDNPITGRIAFWTDDECAKVNINTASEGVYMDTPRVGTVPEINLANNQPAQHEFYRYPGHPSMTSLSTVFGSWMPLPPGGTPANAYAGLTPANFAQYLKPYYDLAPRVVDGPAGTSPATSILLPDRDRLYASIDELMFSPVSSGGNRVQNKNGSGVVFTRQQIEQSKFFITANSRSPDVNLFSQPRVCIWPLHATNDSTHRTTLDNLIAFCSTQNGNKYYFQRADSTSPVNDISIGRNQELLGYLRRLAGMPVPGFAASASDTFNAKYNKGSANDMDQIFTEIFDYIRSTNTCDSALTSAGWFTKIAAGRTYASNEVVPSYDSVTDTKGFGRFLSPSQASLVFIATADGDWNADPAHRGYFTTGTSAGPAFPSGYTDLNVGAGKIGMKAALLLDLYDVANGYPAMTSSTSSYSFVVTGLASFGLNMPSPVTLRLSNGPNNYARGYGGAYGPSYLYIPIAGIMKGGSSTPVPVSSNPIILDKSSGSFVFNGGIVTVEVHYKDASGKDNTIQTVNFKFPGGSFPLPKLVNSDLVYSGTDTTSSTYLSASQTPWSIPATDGTSRPITSSTATSRISPGDVLKGEPGKPFPWVVPIMPKGFQFYVNSSLTYPQLDFTKFADRFDFNSNSLLTTPSLYSQTGGATGGVYGVYHGFSTITPYDTVRSIQSTSGDIRLSAAKQRIEANDPVFSPHPYYNTSGQSLAHSLIHPDGTPLYGATRGVLAPGVQGPTSLMSPHYGQMTNWGAFMSTYTLYYAPVGKTGFPGYTGIPGMPVNGPLSPGKRNTSAFNGVTCPNWGPIVNSTDPAGGLNQISTIYTLEPQVRSTDGVAAGYAPAVPTTSFTDWQDAPNPKVPGDWDNGVANIKDGAYINKPDEGALTGVAGQSPYFDWNQSANVATAAMFSPNRQIPSAAMFGSLPTGVKANQPWQTLLFRPDPGPGHKGAQAPQDHLLLDLFTMPVVEPYPISEPLSTAGRVNMNYQIVPFTYINRDTGIRAVLKGERILSIPNVSSGGGSTLAPGIKPYKTNYSTDTAGTNNSAGPKYMRYDLRFDINANETLKGFQARFDANDIFHSATEICTLDLIPNDSDYKSVYQCKYPPVYSADGSAMRQYWSEHALTGDNSRERPYADIYPRLTTKSNTFTVHFRVQTLTKVKGSRPDLWTEGRDAVSSEYRGSQIIERYIDPNDSRLNDYATATQPPLDTLYKFRVLSSKRFAP